jgi:RND superfamily putative drug exporter
VFGLWFVLTIGVFAASLIAGGTNAAGAVSSEQRSRFEAGEAYEIFGKAATTAGQEEPSQQLLLIASVPNGTVQDAGPKAAIADIVKRLGELRSTVGGKEVATVDEIVDPLTAPPTAGLVAPDGTAVRIPGRVLGDGDALDERLKPVPAFLDEIRAAHPGLEIHALNNRLANQDIQELVNGGLDDSLRLTIPLTFLILLVAFGAVVAAVVPLVMAVTCLLAAFGILALYSQFIAPASPYASQLVVLIGLAVSVDYSLFMITRFRSERRHGRDRLASINVASATAGRAVFFSGLAVMVSIAGLFILDDPLFRSMAVGTIAVILFAVIGSLTFLPATLAIVGDNVNRLRIPFVSRSRPEGSGIWAAVVRRVMAHPLPAAVLSAAVLMAIAWPALRLHTGQADFTAFPDSIDGVQAVNVLNAKWPTNGTLELSIVVTGADQPATKAALANLDDKVLAIDGVGGPSKTFPSADDKVAMVIYHMGGGTNDERNRNIVREVRREVVPEVFGGLAGVRALVSGDVAYALDVVDYYATNLPVVILFVLTLSFLLLLVAFRSIVIPIKAIILNLLSTAAAFGVLVFVFQDGHGADILGFKPGPIESFIPIFIFTILFGLSMDYHVFILTRIKEARDHGMSSNEAVARGISITAGTITSAAAIMVVVFAVFVTLELVIIKQLGLGLAVAIFLDATIVRSVLLPATMRLLGDWNWWLPSWLNWLPHVTIEADVEGDEGEGEEAEGEEGHPEPAGEGAPAAV